MEVIATMKMFGVEVNFCNCDTRKAFLTGNDGTIPVRLGRIVEGEKDSQDHTESIIDTMDA